MRSGGKRPVVLTWATGFFLKNISITYVSKHNGITYKDISPD